MKRWGGVLFVVLVAFLLTDAPAAQTGGGGQANPGSVLTAQERAWLAAHPTIRLGPEEDYGPISFFDEQGRYRGITADYFALIQQRLGIHFEVVRARPGDPTSYRDIGPISAPTAERLKVWRYSSLYLEFPAYIIVRSSVTRSLTLEDLAGARVAVVDGYAAQEHLSAQRPALVVDPVPDTRTGLRKASFGLVDAFVSDLPVATYWMEKEGITNLRIAGESGYVYRMGIASRGDWPELAQILEKGLSLVSPAERDEIFRRWVSLPPPPPASRRYVIGLAAALVAAALVVAAVLLWNRSLTSQVARRTQELAHERDRLRVSEERFSKIFRSTPDAIVLSRPSAGGVLVEVNEGFERLSGYSAAEAIGRTTADLGLWLRPEVRLEMVKDTQAQGRLRRREFEGVTRTGERRLCSLSAELIEIGGEMYGLSVVRDITEQRQAEQELRRSEERLRLALEAARMGTWEWDLEQDAMNWAKGAEVILGVPEGQPLAAHRSDYLALVHPEDRPMVERVIADALRGAREDFQILHRFSTPAGDSRWLEVHGRVYRDSAGKPLHLRGTLADATERKRAEDALRYSEERWQRLSEAAWEGIGLSEDGRLIDANAQLADMLGFRLEELIGKSVVELIAPESRATVAEHVAAATSQAYEHVAVGRDGSVFPVEVRGRTLSREGRTIRVTAVRDVSERARLEAELRRAAQEWRDTFDALEAGIVVLGPDGRIQRMNRSALDALGRGLPKDVPFDELGAAEPWGSLVELRRGGLPSGTEVKDPRSGHCWLLVASRLRREGEPESTILVFRDVTETATLRERLQRGEKLAAMGALVAGVAHEVRTPLFSITASLDAFEAEVGPGQSEIVSLLRSQAARLTHLMRDLLDYGSPAALRRVTGGVGDALRQAARTCAPLAREAGVGLEVSVGEGLLPVSRDSARLEQVFQNLLANAVQHAPRGSSVRATVRSAEGPRSGVEVRFEDAGPGLGREDIGRVFQPFFSRRKGGTGLGLSIVQRLVEDHDGTVTAGNQPGGGAVFTVFLPAAEPSGVEAGAEVR